MYCYGYWLLNPASFSLQFDIFHRSGAKDCLDDNFHAPRANTAQLLTLRQHRAKNQYRMVNQI